VAKIEICCEFVCIADLGGGSDMLGMVVGPNQIRSEMESLASHIDDQSQSRLVPQLTSVLCMGSCNRCCSWTFLLTPMLAMKPL